MVADLRDALRQLRKAPGFTATAVITLALGIGATTAIFTLVHQVMLKSLPVANPDDLWRIGDKVRCCNWGGYTQGAASLGSAAGIGDPGAACGRRRADGGAAQRVIGALRCRHHCFCHTYNKCWVAHSSLLLA